MIFGPLFVVSTGSFYSNEAHLLLGAFPVRAPGQMLQTCLTGTVLAIGYEEISIT